jgi:hypothetical protein
LIFFSREASSAFSSEESFKADAVVDFADSGGGEVDYCGGRFSH